MKILIQNPTLGPLITVSFDEDTTKIAQGYALVGASRVTVAAAEGLATLRSAAQFAELAPGVAGAGPAGGAGALGIAGPLALIGMLFAAGDNTTPPDEPERDASHHIPSPAELRCMMDPYNTSAECAAVRSALSVLPFSESWLNIPNATRASIDPHTHSLSETVVGAADLAEEVTPTTPLEEELAFRQHEAQTIVAVLREELAEIDRRLGFSSTTDEMRDILNARREQHQLEMTDAVFAGAGIVAPRTTPEEGSGTPLADLKWPGPIPIITELPSDHDPKVVPQDVLQAYLRYARQNDHTAVMLLWNTQENRYELERGWPRSITFNPNMRLVRTALPTFLPRIWFSTPGLDLTWYFVPSHEHLNVNEQWGVSPAGPLVIDTLIRVKDVEAVVSVRMVPLRQETPSPTTSHWRGFEMNFTQIYPGKKPQEAHLYIAYEQGSDRRLLVNFSDILTASPEGNIVTGYVTPGIDTNMGREAKLSIHLQRDKKTGLIVGEFHANLMPSTFNFRSIFNGVEETFPMFLLVERDGQRIVYRFNSQDLIDILQQAPEAGPRLGEETHTIIEIATQKPATVRVVDGQFKSITIDGHTEWYDQPVNRIMVDDKRILR